jgi:hypothetical protein
MSVRPSTQPPERLDGFPWNLVLGAYTKNYLVNLIVWSQFVVVNFTQS